MTRDCEYHPQIAHSGNDAVQTTCPQCGEPFSASPAFAQFRADVGQEVYKRMVRDAASAELLAETNPAPAFACVSSVDDVALAPEEPEHLVGDFCPLGSIVLFSATAKAGKTSFLQNLGVALAKGEPSFLGFDLIRNYTRAVLYVNLDEDARRFRSQIKSLGAHERFKHLHLAGGELDVTIPSHVSALAQACVANDVGVVMLDVWSSAFSGEENSNTEVIAGWNGIQALRAQANLDCIIVAHHSGKGAPGTPRGASAFAGKVDVLWSYQELADGSGSMFSVAKGRGVSGVDSFLVTYDYNTHAVSRGASGVERMREANAERQRSTEDDVERRIHDAVAASPRITSVGIQETVGGSRGLVTRVRRKMVDAGTLTEEREGNGRLYTVAPAVENAAP